MAIANFTKLKYPYYYFQQGFSFFDKNFQQGIELYKKGLFLYGLKTKYTIIYKVVLG
jgi:hypothetical protein